MATSGMTDFWRRWLFIWCLAIFGFGLILAGGALPATDGPIRLLLGILGGGAPVDFSPVLRFSLAVMGPVSMGWAITCWGAIRAADLLGARGGPIWRLVTAGALTWFVVDPILSVATGFWPNVIPNIGYIVAFLIPVLKTGVLSASRA